MGTEITLEVGGVAIDYSKNFRGNDHGMLFQDKDRKRIHCDQIDYDYFKENDEDPRSMEMAFCRPLREVVPRLELLGFTLDQVEREYAGCVNAWREERQAGADDEEEPGRDVMSFAEFCAFVTAHPVEFLDDTSLSDKPPGLPWACRVKEV